MNYTSCHDLEDKSSYAQQPLKIWWWTPYKTILGSVFENIERKELFTVH